jgi:hypothetical protein
LAIAYRASTSQYVSTGSITLTIPGGVQSGDCMLIFGGQNDGGSSAVDWAIPAGWTRLDSRQIPSNFYGAVFMKVAGSGDAGTTVTLSTSSAAKSSAILVAYSGTDPVSPINGIAAASETVSTTSHTTPTLATTVTNCQVVIAGSHSDSTTESWSTASGFTKRADIIDNTNLGGHIVGTVQDKAAATVDTYGGDTLATAAPSAKAAMWTVALAPTSSTQVARPTSDVASSGAVGVPTPGGGSGIYADLAANVDTSYAEISNAGYVEVGFAALVDPQSASGHTIRYRAEFAGGAASGTLAVVLKEGSTTRASWTDTLAGAFGAFSHTLTSGEANAIGDYSALRVRFTASLA